MNAAVAAEITLSREEEEEEEGGEEATAEEEEEGAGTVPNKEGFVAPPLRPLVAVEEGRGESREEGVVGEDVAVVFVVELLCRSSNFFTPPSFCAATDLARLCCRMLLPLTREGELTVGR